jgi:hypothetical protein
MWMARLKSAFTTFGTTWSGWMVRSGRHGKVGLVTFVLAFVALSISHFVFVPRDPLKNANVFSV